MVFVGPALVKGRWRGAVKQRSPMALHVGDETVKGEIVHIKVKNDFDACKGVVLNFSGAVGKLS